MPTEDHKDYLSLAELVERIPYKPQTIYNWIHAGVWQLGVHYYKPTPRKLIFHYPTIQRWVGGTKHWQRPHESTSENGAGRCCLILSSRRPVSESTGLRKQSR